MNPASPAIPSQFHQILTDGGMGDLVCGLVAVDYNIRNYPQVHFHVWVPDYLYEFSKHVLTPGASIRPFSKAKSKFRHDIEGMTMEWCTNHTCIRTHAVDYGFHMLSDRHVYDLNEKNYLQIKPEKIDVSRFDLPKNYVVLSATSIEPVRTMPTETANAIIDFVIEKGYAPIFLGKEKSDCGFKDFAIKATPININFNKGINLINKTDMLESAKIIHEAKAFVGMDGGLAHVAGCTDTNIICGYTASNPNHVAPIRRGSQCYKFMPVEPELSLKNRYYQTYSSFKKGNFQRFEGWEEVVASMTGDKFIKALEIIL